MFNKLKKSLVKLILVVSLFLPVSMVTQNLFAAEQSAVKSEKPMNKSNKPMNKSNKPMNKSNKPMNKSDKKGNKRLGGGVNKGSSFKGKANRSTSGQDDQQRKIGRDHK